MIRGSRSLVTTEFTSALRSRVGIAVIVLVSMVAMAQGCATAPVRTAAVKSEGWIREELYFGAAIPGGGEVSNQAWEHFVEEEIVPRFPGGFTILEGKGRWRHADGSNAEERTRIFVIVRTASDGRAERAVAALAEAYKRRFRQESVLRVTDPVEARF
jgi:hypothetical protein